MAYIEGHARDQALLLPASVEDYVAADNPVRFIDAFVDDLDLGEADFHRARPKATGRPGYDPGDMLKLYLYGYLNRVRSSRRLEAEATRNLELIWLLRGLRPDYKTIADFRRDNRGAFKAVFRAFVTLCRKLDLFGRELLAVDGTRLKAVNNPGRNFSRDKLARYIAAADERIEGYLAELDAIDRGEDGHGPGRGEALSAKIAHVRERRQAQEAMLGQLNASGESQVSLTDADARAMVTGQKTIVGYNAQVAVDAKHKLIVEQHVTNAATDMGLLAVTAGAAREALDVERIAAVADMPVSSLSRGATTRARTSRPARRTASRLMSPGPNGAARSPTAAFPRSVSLTIQQPTPTIAPAAGFSTPATARSRTAMCRSSIPAPPPVPPARSRHAVPVAAGGASTAGRTRRCSIAWRNGSRPGPASSPYVAKRSSIRSARSSSG